MDKYDTSEYKVTYLIGAGASAKCFPTVKKTETNEGIANSLRTFAGNLKNDTLISPSNKKFAEQFALDLNWLADNSDKFGTPDTFAKFLYLHDRNSINRVKNALSFYFTVEQLINRKLDERVLIFLTTVLKIKNIFPTNIKILNWNYDFQIELACESFCKETFHYKKDSGTTRSKPLLEYYPSLGFEFNVNYHSLELENFSMVHLNGIAGFYFDENTSCIMSNFIDKNPKDINEIIEKIMEGIEKKHHLLTFAWETETVAVNFLRKRMEIAKAIIKDSDILVVIGYSFPFFNREVDKALFESLTDSGKLKKIFYQDPYKSGEFLKKQFGLSDDIEILHTTEKDNYFVPNEL